MTSFLVREAAATEASRLYEEAKQASFEGRFAEAERRHLTSAFLFESLGDSDLAARAYMRALWYRIENNGVVNDDTIDRAAQLSPLQTAAGLHQAIEFAIFAENESAFQICTSKLKLLLPIIGVSYHQSRWNDEIPWATCYASIGVDIYRDSLSSRLSGDSWQWSDQARTYYFSLTHSIGDRISFLNTAARLFEEHGICYRALFCKAEAAILSAGVATEISVARKQLKKALLFTGQLVSHSDGVLRYRSIIEEVARFGLACLNCNGNEFVLDRTDAQLDFLLNILGVNICGRGGFVDVERFNSQNPFKSVCISWYQARLGGLCTVNMLVNKYILRYFEKEFQLKNQLTGSISIATKLRVVDQFDVFVSYRSEDLSFVTEIVSKLQGSGLNCWFDKWRVPPGQSWLQYLEKDILLIRSAAIMFGIKGLSDWQRAEYEALFIKFNNLRRPLIPVLLPGYPGDLIPPLLASRVVVNFEHADPSPIQHLIDGIKAAPQI